MTDWAQEAGVFLKGRKHTSSKYGEYYLCNCPLHEDKKRSLSIRDDGGVPRVTCFAGCDDTRIMEYLVSQHVWPEDHPALLKIEKDQGKRVEHRYVPSTKPAVKKNQSVSAAALSPQAIPCVSYPAELYIPASLRQSGYGPWHYQNTDQKYVLSIYRFDELDTTTGVIIGKEFRQLTPRVRNNKKLRWESQGLGMDESFKLMLYGHEKILDADLIVFVEGEKCVDVVHQIGDKNIAAVTIPGNFFCYLDHIDFTCLKDKCMVIWPDYDAPGFIKAAQIFAHLTDGSNVAALRQVAILSEQDLREFGLSEKEDVADYLAQENTSSFLYARLNELLQQKTRHDGSIELLYGLINGVDPDVYIQKVPITRAMLDDVRILGFETDSAYYLKPDNMLEAIHARAAQMGQVIVTDPSALFENWMNQHVMVGDLGKLDPGERYYHHYSLPGATRTSASSEFSVIKIPKIESSSPSI